MGKPVKIASDGTIWKWNKTSGYMPVRANKPHASLTKFRIRKLHEHTMPELIKAAQGICYLCGKTLDGDLNRDHVKPKHQGNPYKANTMPTHVICNGAKGGRQPYPCELIYLDAVNLRLGEKPCS